MKKGAEASFPEHEADTAQRAYPALADAEHREHGDPDPGKRTTKMAAFDLDNILRTESGTRPAISPDMIEERAREKLAASDPLSRLAGEFGHQDLVPNVEKGPFHPIAGVEVQQESLATPAMAFPITALPELAKPTTPPTVTPSPITSLAPRSAPEPPRASLAPPYSAHAFRPTVTMSRGAFVFGVLLVLMLIGSVGVIGYELGLRRGAESAVRR